MGAITIFSIFNSFGAAYFAGSSKPKVACLLLKKSINSFKNLDFSFYTCVAIQAKFKEAIFGDALVILLNKVGKVSDGNSLLVEFERRRNP